MIVTYVKRTIAALVVLLVSGTGVVWTTCRIYVPAGSCAVLTRKWGTALPTGQSYATESGQKGIQERVLGPGRHLFYDPLTWEWEIVPLIDVPAGDPDTWEWIHSLSPEQRGQIRSGSFAFKGNFPKVGIVTRRLGKEPADGRVIVEKSSGERGILREVLTPGKYKLNPKIYQVDLQDAIVIPAGFVGVVTNLFDMSELKDQPNAEN